MLPAEEDNARCIVNAVQLLEACEVFLGVSTAVRDGVDVDCESTEGLCDFDFVDFEAAHHLLEHDLIEELLQIKQGIGIAVGKCNHVILIGRFILEM